MVARIGLYTIDVNHIDCLCVRFVLVLGQGIETCWRRIGRSTGAPIFKDRIRYGGKVGIDPLQISQHIEVDRTRFE